jgi:hypothetical protein
MKRRAVLAAVGGCAVLGGCTAGQNRATPNASAGNQTRPEQAVTPSSPPGTIPAAYRGLQGRVNSYFRWYAPTRARLTTTLSAYDDLAEQMDLLMVVQAYPNGDLLGMSRAGAIRTDQASVTTTVSYEPLPTPGERPFKYVALLVPTAAELSDLSREQTVKLCATDRLTAAAGELRKDPHPQAKGTLRTEAYSRIAGEGIYDITTTGEHNIELSIYKAAYVSESERPLQSIRRSVREAIDSGIGAELADILGQNAARAGQTTDREKVNYTVDAVQSLPFVSDSDEYDNYSKYPTETLVEGGDCEDTTILLAAVLASKPFEYGTALVYLPPENPIHVGLGIRGTSKVDGVYYEVDGVRYYYVETTGYGWEIGDLPEKYQDTLGRTVPI